MADNARAWAMKMHGKDDKSDGAHMVLCLMDTEQYGNNYSGALAEVLAAFPEIDRAALEKELDRYI